MTFPKAIRKIANEGIEEPVAKVIKSSPIYLTIEKC